MTQFSLKALSKISCRTASALSTARLCTCRRKNTYMHPSTTSKCLLAQYYIAFVVVPNPQSIIIAKMAGIVRTNLPTSNSGNPGWCHLSSFLFDVSLCLSLFLLLHFIIISHMLLPPFQIICRPTFFTPCLTTHIIQKFMQNITSFVVGCCWHSKLANIEVR